MGGCCGWNLRRNFLRHFLAEARRGLYGHGPWPWPSGFPRLDPTAVSGPCRTDNVRVQAWFGSETLYTTFRVSPGPLFFRKEKVIRCCVHLVLVAVTKLRTGTELRDSACALQTAQWVTVGLHMKIYWESPVGAWNVILTSDVLRASSNNSFKDY
jgi:hypothetical protein